MGRAQTQAQAQAQATIPPTNNLYPQELQLKLYQAFIFSIPILFSIILFLLFYLFYLKKRASNLSSQPPPPPSRVSGPNHVSSFLTSPMHLSMKGDLKDKLQVVIFDEELKARESLCCVCLGEFEAKEELRQVPACKHVFHFDCIRSWLCANATCPLCRCHIILSGGMKPPPQQEDGGFPTREEHVLHIEQHTRV